MVEKIQIIIIIFALHIYLQSFLLKNYLEKLFTFLSVYTISVAIVNSETDILEFLTSGWHFTLLISSVAWSIVLYAKLRARILIEEHIEDLLIKVNNQQLFKLVLDNFHEAIAIIKRGKNVGYSNQEFFTKFNEQLEYA